MDLRLGVLFNSKFDGRLYVDCGGHKGPFFSKAGLLPVHLEGLEPLTPCSTNARRICEPPRPGPLPLPTLTGV